ncbi:MAG: LysM peptidoglycan-binding domain-containing protein [Acidimicrobiales bacterium]
MRDRHRIPALVASLGLMASLLFAGNAGAAVRRSPDETSHTVRQGEMLSAIARQHGITLDALAAANGITDPDFVLAGRLLTVPVSGNGSADTYEVRAGDTLSEIALRVGASPHALARLNGLSDPNHVRVGQRLQIVGTAPAELPDSLRTRPERAGLVDDFVAWAATYEVPSDLLMALAYVESGWQSDVVSSAGAVGVGQLMPDTVELIRNVLLPGVALDPLEPEDSVRMTARYLRYLRHRTDSWDDAIGAYFQGLAGLRRDGHRPATNAYIAAVSANRTIFST